MKEMKKIFFIISIILLICLCSCSTVPKETVELSYAMGQDLAIVKKSYIELINNYFDLLQNIRLDYLEKEWTPMFIKQWVEDGYLVDIANGKLVWSVSQQDFVTPTKDSEMKELFTTINSWSLAAIQAINEKKIELIQPLESERKELLSLIDDAFDRFYRSNSAITSYLNSIRKVKEVQDDILKALNLSDLQKEIDKKLQDISKYAEEGLEVIKQTDGIVNTVESVKRSLKKEN